MEILNNVFASMTVTEFIAAAFGLISVWYAQKANILVYPTGIISVLIYVYICFDVQLYADAGINIIYFFMSVYGWWFWTRKDANKKNKPIKWCSGKQYIISILFFIFLMISIYFSLKYFKESDTAYWDSFIPIIDTFTTSVFIIAMFYMALKKIENWILWIVGDIISVPLYFYKDLYFTSAQYIVFLILAVMGLFNWIKLSKIEH